MHHNQGTSREASARAAYTTALISSEAFIMAEQQAGRAGVAQGAKGETGSREETMGRVRQLGSLGDAEARIRGMTGQQIRP